MHALAPVSQPTASPAASGSALASRTEPLVLLAIVAGSLVLSGLEPRDRATWLLEIAPVALGVPILIGTWRRFPLTALSYRLLALHAVLLAVGAHYTFTEVPAGAALRDLLGLARNPFDRVVHLAGGLVPAIVAREILRRRTSLSGGWLFWIVALSCLAGSAVYELLEWWAAAAIGADAAAFLATQGDPWDTQWDMFLGLVGAVAGQRLFSRLHDRQMEELRRRGSAPAGRGWKPRTPGPGNPDAKKGAIMKLLAGGRNVEIPRDVVEQAPPGRGSGEPLEAAPRSNGAEAGWGEEWWSQPRPGTRRRRPEAPAHWLALAEAP